METSGIEINGQFKRAIDLMENTAKNIFITGRAGTGKSTLLSYFMETTAKNVVVLAPTGVSALNVDGETIHSFFRFKPDITLDKIKKISGKNAAIYKQVDTIVIDEISMVRADLMDYADRFMRLNGRVDKPFGGTQMIFIGDLYQLPPVVTSSEREVFTDLYPSPYFFDSTVFHGMKTEFVELEKIYRQKDEKFINILNTVRNNTAGEKELAELNKRVGAKLKGGDYLVHLTPLNREAGKINSDKLMSLGREIKTFLSSVSGEFREGSYPAEEELSLCEGAQVMFLNNDSKGRWVNGSLGRVSGFEPGEDGGHETVIVEIEDGGLVEVAPHSWELFHYLYDNRSGKIKTETVGVFTQYPLKLAWAITIHKSQGKTYKKLSIDLRSGTFAHGQAYVALSRCISLEGLSLKTPFSRAHIRMDWRVVRFLTEYQYKISEAALPLAAKEALIEKAIKDGRKIEIIYLKRQDEKSRRVISPVSIGKCEFNGRGFRGLRAFCDNRKEERTFKVERILEIKEL